MVLNVHSLRFIRDGGKGVWMRGGGGGVGVGGGARRDYILIIATLPPLRMTYALRWAAMRAILIFHNCEGQSHKTVPTDHNF